MMSMLLPMIRRAHLALWCALVLALAACTSLAPQQRTVEVETPASWPLAGLDGGTLPARWWTLFNDATLDRLIDEALRNNRDAALAVARVDEARALAAVARGGESPAAAVAGGHVAEPQLAAHRLPDPARCAGGAQRSPDRRRSLLRGRLLRALPRCDPCGTR